MNKLFLVALLFAGVAAETLLCTELKASRDVACAAKTEPRCADATAAAKLECPAAPVALPTPAPKPTPAPAHKDCPKKSNDCGASSTSCAGWAKLDQCKQNPDYMMAQCSTQCCGICDVCPNKESLKDCKADTHSRCQAWAAKGECDKNFDWMHKNCQNACCPNCPRSCPAVRTEDCKNDYDVANPKTEKKPDAGHKCKDWGVLGECVKNPVWMNAHCALECCANCKPLVARAPVFLPASIQQPLFNFAQPALLRSNVTQAPVLQASTLLPYAGRPTTALPYSGISSGSYNNAYYPRTFG